MNLSKPLVAIFNESFKTETFPEILKRTKIRPLFKKGEKTTPGNYRPVANISVFAKIFELVVSRKIKDFLTKFLILNKAQFGYQDRKSTTDALVAFVSEIYQGMAERKFIKGFCFDLTKAFDLVYHEILFNKLDKYGIRGPFLSWIKSYLENREQFVEIENCYDIKVTSDIEKINVGVPQGSVLGPLLFILYINDIVENVHIGNKIMFVDDLSILIKCDTEEESRQAESVMLSQLEK